ncbi:MAG: tetratricopeptide repeat protein [Bacteroidetes bacterium]|nr:tetratricopeptide repeat protein [Bacteroidota bacterium]
MKKLFVTLLVAMMAIPVMHAQEATTVVLLNYNSVKKKAEKSDADIQDSKKNVKAATWLKRGEIYQDIFMLGLEQIQEGTPTQTMILFYKEPLKIDSVTKDGVVKEKYIYEHMKYSFTNGVLEGWERLDPIHEDPLRVAMDAYFKASEFDEKGKLGIKIKEHLSEIKGQLKRQGVNSYYKGSYDKALYSFENVLEVNNQEIFAGEFDTIMVQYAGIISREIASKTNDKELYLKAIDYYKELTEIGFGGPNTHLQIKMDYFAIGDTLAALEAIKEAFVAYPDSTNIIANVADTYIQLKQFDEGIEFMDAAIEQNGGIAESYYWRGRLLINKEEVEFIDKAIESYKKAGELDPSIYYIWYDMGYIYYLQGADFYERSNTEEHEGTREQLLELGKEKYTESIPALEKAFTLNEDNADVKFETLDLLQRIYYKEQMMEEYERVKDLKDTL